MIESTATPFAQASLLSHARQGTFTIDLPSGEDGEEVARAFEGLGCTVEPAPFELALRITAPRSA